MCVCVSTVTTGMAQPPELTLTASGMSHTAAGSMRTRRVTSETIASVFLNLNGKIKNDVDADCGV